MKGLTSIDPHASDSKESKDFRQQVNNIWKFLDDLAESDPAQYYEFQRQQRQVLSQEMKYQAQTSHATDAANIRIQANASQTGSSTNANSGQSPMELYDLEKQLASLQKSGKSENYFNPIPKFVIKSKIDQIDTKIGENGDQNDINSQLSMLNLNNNNNKQSNKIELDTKLFINFFESPHCKPLLSRKNGNQAIDFNNDQVVKNLKLPDIMVPFQCSSLQFEFDTKQNKCLRVDAILHSSVFYLLTSDKIQKDLSFNRNLFEKWIAELVIRQVEANFIKMYQNKMHIAREYKKLKNRKYFGKMAAKPQYIGPMETSAKDVNKASNAVGSGTSLRLGEVSDSKEDKISIIEDGAGANESECQMREVPSYWSKIDMKKEKKMIKISIKLEKEKSISGIDLNVSETQLTLKSSIYSLNIKFASDIKEMQGKQVDPDTVKAKFDKEKRVLSVKIQIVSTS